MAVNLNKGQVVSLRKESGMLGVGSLRNAIVALGWDCNTFGASMDLDAWALALNTNDRIAKVDDLIYYGNLKGLKGCIRHSGDNLTGAGDGDDESILIDFEGIDEKYNAIFVGVTIYRGHEKHQSFAKVKNAFIRLYDKTTGIEIFRYADGFGQELSNYTTMLFGVFFKEYNEWKFKALGVGNESNSIHGVIGNISGDYVSNLLLPATGLVAGAVADKVITNNTENSQGGKRKMAVSLSKGGKVSLAKVAADAGIQGGLSKVIIGLGWDTNRYDGGAQFDLDAAAFLQGANKKVRSEDDFIFYNQKKGPGIEHTGDNRTGEGDGDDEQIKIDLNAIPADVERISFTVTIDQAAERGQSFGMVENSYVRVLDEVTGAELIRYDLGEDYSVETAIVVAELYRHNGEWKFNAVGSGFAGGLAALCGNFGIEVG